MGKNLCTGNVMGAHQYYEYSQLARLNRILALKDLGFSLEEIGRLLADGLPLEQLRGMLKLREAESRQGVLEEAKRLKRIEARLRQIEQELQTPFENPRGVCLNKSGFIVQ